MGEVRKMDMNPYEMDSGYPDSLSSSPRSRETDSEQRWEAGDSTGGGSRVRLMCSYGGKILPRPHDNQLTYVGGDTRILAVDRNIRFSNMIGKLSSLWGSSVSFKYQLPNEDLDALVSVTNDEDMENMMAEYDRLQKMGYRFSRLRLFVFVNKPDGASSQSSMGSLMEETKRENWFVDALNVGPVSSRCEAQSETVPQGGPWMHNMPDFLFGLEGNNAVEGDRSRNYVPDQKAAQEVYIGRDSSQQQPEVQSAPNSPIVGYSSVDSIASAPARINTSAAPHGSDQADLGRGFEQDSNLRSNPNANPNSNPKPNESSPVAETGPVLKSADRPANSNFQKQEQQYTSERASQQQIPAPPPQVPIQEFQKLQLRQQQQQQQDPIARPVDDNANPNMQGRRIYSDPVRAMNLPNQEMNSRPNPVDQIYMPQQQQVQEMNNRPNPVDQIYMPQQQQVQEMNNRPNPVDQVYMPQQQQIQQNPAPSEYYMHDQGSHFVPQSYWQMQEPTHGDQQFHHPVYFVHAGSPMPMSAVRPMGQPVAPGGAAGGSYYNPVQRMASPVQVYSSEAAPLSNPVTTVRAGPAVLNRQTGPDPTEPYRETVQIAPPVPKGPYAAPPPGPVVSDARMLYRPSMPVPMAHPDTYSYQNVMYEQGPRQVYYTQAPPAMNPQYQAPPAMNPAMNPQYQAPPAMNPAMNPQYQAPPAMNPQYQSGRVSPVELQGASSEMASSEQQPKLARIPPPS